MKRLRKKCELVFVALGIAFFANVHAQSTSTPTPIPIPPLVPNPLLTERAEAISKQAMRVVREESGVVSLTLLQNRQSLANKTQILFFRRKNSRMEVIANGVVSGEQKNKQGGAELLVDIDRDTIVKYPIAGDFAIPMADPNASAAGEKKDQYDYLTPEEETVKVDNERPGYLEAGLGLLQGSMNSTPSTQADDNKDPSGYRFKDFHFAYFSGYVPLGVELDSHSGNFPTSTYYQTVVKSSESISNFGLSYRFKPWFNKHLAASLKVNILSDTFQTDNPDEHLLSTKTSGLGFGFHLNWDFVSPIWKPEKKKIAIVFQQVFVELLDYPSITAQDQTISRGTASSGSSAIQYRLGFTSLAYLPFVPLFKRFVFQASYGARSYSLKFQGTTTSEAVPGAFQIPQNSTSKISESDIRFFVGIRIEDPLKLLLSPEKNDGKKDKP